MEAGLVAVYTAWMEAVGTGQLLAVPVAAAVGTEGHRVPGAR